MGKRLIIKNDLNDASEIRFNLPVVEGYNIFELAAGFVTLRDDHSVYTSALEQIAFRLRALEELEEKFNTQEEKIKQIVIAVKEAYDTCIRTKSDLSLVYEQFLNYFSDFGWYNDSSSAEYIKIEKIGFSTRVYNALKRRGIKTLEDLLSFSISDLLRIRNVGLTCVSEIEEKVREFGYELKPTKIKNIYQ